MAGFSTVKLTFALFTFIANDDDDDDDERMNFNVA